MERARILIVEDERIIALDLGQRLTALGYEVCARVPGGAAAIDQADALRPDLVLMDVHLEGDLAGTEAARLIHERLGIPVVFLTAYTGDDTLNRAMASLPYGYLVKPVDTRALHAALRTALTRHAAERARAGREQELRQALDKARQSDEAYENLSEGLFTLDAQRRLIAANPAFTALTGYTLDEVLGHNPEEFLHARRHGDPFYQCLAEQGAGRWQGETWCRRKSGEVFPVWESMRAVLDESGRVRHFVASIADISGMHQAGARVLHLAYHDALTGLPNRVAFEERLRQALADSARSGGRCALLFIDLDGFKAVNDGFGHACGDQLLRLVARRIQGVLRASDTVARLGGDEFVVIATDLGQPEITRALADKLLAVLNQPVELEGRKVGVSASIGIALHPDDGADADALLRAADQAMYAAKNGGKNRVMRHRPPGAG